uniref:Aurein-5.1 n=2 Tax=Ranoidea TaxID=2777416 RepID=AUR51_RANAE|nr:RecName: Full=Aurein-5.1 [Ranoidea raniformis]P69029.1 RecName: Full=Aurein-5.1 [Ranoidea aurea]
GLLDIVTGLLGNLIVDVLKPKTPAS